MLFKVLKQHGYKQIYRGTSGGMCLVPKQAKE
jgi:hypothetical protein